MVYHTLWTMLKKKVPIYKVYLKLKTNQFNFTDKLDIEVLQDGVRVFIDKKAQLSLLGKYLINK